ncbi:MAG: hypothetical protein ABI333_10145 [bacterium]
MSDSDLRKILRDVIDEVDGGRLKLWRPIQAVRRLALPAVLAASIGGAACDSEAVGTPQDARPDVWNYVSDAYGVPFDAWVPPQDGAIYPDADLTDDAGAADDAEVIDDGSIFLYMGPPPIDPDDSDD